ncbi:regulator of nonsense transcripts 2-like [Bacillus rossius redtenbacheri]|uniref:regulator of nonsense transcripts 2-like n=1 Tax=Bacillus rossius redtenbacheri TaxID=93214 RepID=UPI002FDE3A44
MVSTDMEPGSPTDRVVPERRAKSWRREHEERCSRRLQKKNGQASTTESYLPDEGVSGVDSSSKCDASDGGQSGTESSECETNSVDESSANAECQDSQALLSEFSRSKLTANSTDVFSAIKNICELECSKYDCLSKDIVSLAEDSDLEGKIVDVSELESTIIRDLGGSGGVECDQHSNHSSVHEVVNHLAENDENDTSLPIEHQMVTDNDKLDFSLIKDLQENSVEGEELNADDSEVSATQVDELSVELEVSGKKSSNIFPEGFVGADAHLPAVVSSRDSLCEATSSTDSIQLIEKGTTDVDTIKDICVMVGETYQISENGVGELNDSARKDSSSADLLEHSTEKFVEHQGKLEAVEVCRGTVDAVVESASKLAGCGDTSAVDAGLEHGVVITSAGNVVSTSSGMGNAPERPDISCADLTLQDSSPVTETSFDRRDVILITSESQPTLTDESDDIKYKNELEMYIAEANERLTTMAKLRQLNQNVANLRPDDSYFSKLDSSLKKNTSFVRKLKMFAASQLEPLLRDMATLNLTKYVSEVAAALVEAKLKMSDVPHVVKLCGALHRDYADFAAHLLENWQKVMAIRKDDKSFNQSKLRVDLRFYAELINAGIFTHKEGLPLLGNVLTVLINMDKEEHNNINIISTFCRYCGEDYAGLTSRKVRQMAEKYNMTIPRSTLLSKDKQRNVRTLLKDYYTSLCKHLLKEHRELQAFERQNKKILQTKGELSSERRERGNALQTSVQRLHAGTLTFSEVLDEDLPSLPQEDVVDIESLDLKVGNSESEDGILSSNLWEDEDTQNFYEVLPNMKDFLPSLTIQSTDPEAQVSEEALEADLEEIEECLVAKDEEEEPLPPDPEEVEEPESQANISNKIMLDSFLTNLPQCVNREMIDSAAVDFVMTLNTKYNRKKLVKMLFSVQRTRLDLLPFYARLVAILHPVMPDVAAELGQFLKQDFKYHIRKKDQINIESKIKVVRFIGELVKFKMYSKIEALYCLKLLLHDFTHHHIEMCCNLLESCGRFLFRHPDSHQRTKAYLEQMMRKKSVTALDSRYVTMIENAYYHVNPPELAPCVKKERPPMHEFIRKILYQDLTKPSTDKVLRLMRKLNWESDELAAYAVKCLTHAFNVKYYNIRCLANLVAGLVTYQELVGTQVVDGVMEDIRLGMEINQVKYNQRRVAMVKYLGELYNYRMVESGDIFKVLYSLITFGVSMRHEVPSILDPPDHLFRIRLVCILLETCGQYFNNGISKRKLDYFLSFFQNYYWFKFSSPHWTAECSFPIGMTHMFRDTIVNLRPNIHLYADYEEAQRGIEELKEEFASTVLQQLQDSGKPPAGGAELGTIVENAAELDDQKNEDDRKRGDDGEAAGKALVSSGEVEDNDTTQHSKSLDVNGTGACGGAPKEDDEVKEEDEYRTVDGRYNFDEDEDGDDQDDNEESERTSEFDDMSPATSQSQGDDVNLLGTLLHGPTCVECPEDDDFQNAFEQMVSSNIQERMHETIKPRQVDISVPLHVKNSTKKTYEQLHETKSEEKSMVNFVLMVRKGHKQQYKSLAVPVTSELALNLRDREEAERAEKERVKRLTLDINERLEEEDYQEMMQQLQRPAVVNLNRERRHKYQHPKGAPDADLIFGSKRAR